ncbi:LOW QUALITY PROTEIN: hypothetical protein Cgig2_030852 [Carnegiea gigantea]|uniref:Uncharacterized protein n=1 Tax=Carnegiea gigantea TaxID=171969 RepID=A0A9Q1QII1_9CARY|nr:LOW QUALITY PROTEIN: hypothetical protein Cgig2_030852 [Carnegiea gigantea]
MVVPENIEDNRVPLNVENNRVPLSNYAFDPGHPAHYPHPNAHQNFHYGSQQHSSNQQQFHSGPGTRRINVQCKYCPCHTIDKCFKLQRMKGPSDKGRRMAAYQSDTALSTDLVSEPSAGQHTLTSEQYKQLLALLNKQGMITEFNIGKDQMLNVSSEPVKTPSFSIVTNRSQIGLHVTYTKETSTGESI